MEEKGTNILRKVSPYMEFEYFVVHCLQNENGIDLLEDENELRSTNNFRYDYYSKSGLKGITDEPVYVEIMYEDNSQIISKKINAYNFSKIFKPFNVVICLLSKMSCDRLHSEYPHIIFLGYDYVLKLSVENVTLWWNFLSSIAEDLNIYSKDGKSITIESYIKRIRVSATLSADEIHYLSDLNENYFNKQKKAGVSLSIITGNGVSIPFGSDKWNVLSTSLFDYLSPVYVDNKDLVDQVIGANTYSKTSLSKMTISKEKYTEALYNSIYRKYEYKMHDNETLLSCIAKAKKKNINIRLFTYNYDNFLEQQYYYQFEENLNSSFSRTSDAKISEPKITHLHGLISYKSFDTKNLVLTSEEYYKAYKKDSWVYVAQYNVLKKDLCLFVGSSLSDLFQMSVINDVKEYFEIKFEENKQFWWCYALLCFKDLTPKDIATVYSYYYKKGVRVIFVDDFEKLPKKLDKLLN